MNILHSIKAKVMLVGVILVIGAIALVAAVLYAQAKSELENLLSEEQFATASRLASQFDREIAVRRNALQRTASFIPLDVLADPDSVQKMLSERPALASLFPQGVSLVGENGATLADLPANAGRRGTSVAERDWFQEMKAHNQVVISEPYIGGATQRPLFVIATPLGNGLQFQGALVATIYLDQDNFFADAFKADANGSNATRNLFVISQKSRVFVASRDPVRTLTALAAPGSNRMSDRYMAGYEGSGIAVSSRGIEELSASKQMSTVPWRVSVATATSVVFKPISSFRDQAIFWAFAFSAIAALALWMVITRFLRPVEQASRAIGRYLASPIVLPEPIPTSGNDEVGTLLHGFARLQSSLIETQEQLRVSEARLHDIIEYAPIGMAIVSLEGRFVLVNQALCQIVGYAKDALEGLTFQEITHADDLALDLENVARLLRGELRWYEMEKRYLRNDGSIVWIQLTATICRDDQGQPLYFISQIQDINERKSVENELRATKQRLELALEASNLSLWDFDIASGRVFLDENWTKIVGGECGERVISVGELFATIHSADRERIAHSAMATIKGGTPGYRDEIRIQSLSGEWKWIACRGKVIERNAAGWALRAVGTNIDITQRKAAAAALAASEQRYRALFENAPMGVALTTFDGAILAANEALSRMLGFRSEELMSINTQSLYANLHERAVLLKKVRQEHSVHGYEVELKRRDGSLFFGSLTVNQLDREEDDVLLSMWEDISERKCAQIDLQESEARFRDIVDYSPIGMVIASREGRLLQVNRALCTMLGYEHSELEQLTFAEITHPDDRTAAAEQFEQLLSGKLPRYQIEERYLRKGGKPVWAQLTASLLRHAGSAAPYVLGQIEDITESRLWREQIYHQAYYDPLTDLPNRRLLLDRVNQALAEAQRRERSAAILFLDLDHFKEINDSLGHDVGDQLLKEVAMRLKTCVRRVDTVSRQGGDEFVIVLTDLERPQDTSLVAKKILDALATPIQSGSSLVTVTTSIGISLYPRDATEDARELIKKADEAMYTAKQDGRNRYRYYHETGTSLNA